MPYCTKCGAEASQPEQFCSSCGVARCSCGMGLPSETRVCPNCGATVARASAQSLLLNSSHPSSKVVSPNRSAWIGPYPPPKWLIPIISFFAAMFVNVFSWYLVSIVRVHTRVPGEVGWIPGSGYELPMLITFFVAWAATAVLFRSARVKAIVYLRAAILGWFCFIVVAGPMSDGHGVADGFNPNFLKDFGSDSFKTYIFLFSVICSIATLVALSRPQVIAPSKESINSRDLMSTEPSVFASSWKPVTWFVFIAIVALGGVLAYRTVRFSDAIVYGNSEATLQIADYSPRPAAQVRHSDASMSGAYKEATTTHVSEVSPREHGASSGGDGSFKRWWQMAFTPTREMDC
jgi:hypothetical protein